MFINSNPLVIVYFTLNGTVADNSTAEDIIEVIQIASVVVDIAAIYEVQVYIIMITTDFSII